MRPPHNKGAKPATGPAGKRMAAPNKGSPAARPPPSRKPAEKRPSGAGAATDEPTTSGRRAPLGDRTNSMLNSPRQPPGTVVKSKTGFGARRERVAVVDAPEPGVAGDEYAATYTAEPAPREPGAAVATLPFFKVSQRGAADEAEGPQPRPGAEEPPPPPPPPPPISLPGEQSREAAVPPQHVSAKTPGGAGFSRTASRMSMLKSPSAKSPGCVRSFSGELMPSALSAVKSPGGYEGGGFAAAATIPALSKQSSLEDMARSCPTPTPYDAHQPRSAWVDAAPAHDEPPQTAAMRRVAASPLFERGPTDVRPTRRSSFLGGTPSTSAIGRAMGVPEYAEVKVERFGWRRGSFISNINSPLLHAVTGGSFAARA
jgi:hypothetical protein